VFRHRRESVDVPKNAVARNDQSGWLVSRPDVKRLLIITGELTRLDEADRLGARTGPVWQEPKAYWGAM
jgi:hypothetical protein